MSTSKTGKHGHAKVHFQSVNIETKKNVNYLCSSTDKLDYVDGKKEKLGLISTDPKRGTFSVVDKKNREAPDISYDHEDSESPLAKIAKKFESLEDDEEIILSVMTVAGNRIVYAHSVQKLKM